MSPHGNIRPQDIIKIAKKAGFSKIRQSGSHAIYSNGSKIIVIPMHTKALGKGLASKLIKEIASK